MNEQLRDFPTDKELSSGNSIQLRIFIPSTREKNIVIKKSAFSTRLKASLRFLAMMFGGSTVNYAFGNYKLGNKIIKEDVAVITINTTVEAYNKYDLKLKEFLINRKKSWGQDSMGFEYEGTLIFV